mgnify:FL=1
MVLCYTFFWVLDDKQCPLYREIVSGQVNWDLDRERAFVIWHEEMLSVKNLDFMWRRVTGDKKAEDYIARYKMLGVRIDCVFCTEVKEMTAHLFPLLATIHGEKPGLKPYQGHRQSFTMISGGMEF